MKGLDLSFAQPSQAWWHTRYAEGWRVMVQDAWTGTVMPASCLVNLNRARTAGFVTAAYVVVNNLPGATAVGHARYACGAEWDYLNFVAVDVEVPTTIAVTRDALSELRRLGKKVCIYTSKNAWKVVSSTTEFKDEWLWNAYYDGDPDFDFFLNPYGGFTRLAGEQYRGTTSLDGYSVDLNNFTATFIEQGGEQQMGLTEADKTVVKQLIELYINHDATLFKDEVNHLIRYANVPRDQAFAALKARVAGHVAESHVGGVTLDEVREEISDSIIQPRIG